MEFSGLLEARRRRHGQWDKRTEDMGAALELEGNLGVPEISIAPLFWSLRKKTTHTAVMFKMPVPNTSHPAPEPQHGALHMFC